MIEGAVDVLEKLFAIVGGAGGIAFWWDRWRRRVTAVGRVVREPGHPLDDGAISLELENRGGSPSSFLPKVFIDALVHREPDGNALFGEWVSREWAVAEEGIRTLTPFVPANVTGAPGPYQEPLPLNVLYSVVRVPVTKGRDVTVYTTSHRPDGATRIFFWTSLLGYRLFNRFRDSDGKWTARMARPVGAKPRSHSQLLRGA